MNDLATTDLPPKLRALIKGYRKHSVCLFPLGDSYERRASNWDGGGQRSITPYILNGGELVPMEWPEGTEPGEFPNFFPGEEFATPEGMIVVSTGTFRGKPAVAYFYMNADTAAELGVTL